MAEEEIEKPKSRLFASVDEEIYRRAFRQLQLMRDSQKGYRDDELLMYLLCEAIKLRSPSTTNWEAFKELYPHEFEELMTNFRDENLEDQNLSDEQLCEKYKITFSHDDQEGGALLVDWEGGATHQWHYDEGWQPE